MRRVAQAQGLMPSFTFYRRWGKGPKRVLRFSKSGEPAIEEAYATHWVSRRASVAGSQLWARLHNSRLNNILIFCGRDCYNLRVDKAGPPDPSGKESRLRVTPEDTARLGGLLLGNRLVSIGVVADGQPVVGLLPYAVSDDRSALLVQASALARHSKGLVAGAPWGGVIHEPDSPGADPLQVPRLQLEGVVDPLRGDRPEFQPCARVFLGRFPQAATTLELPDFTLYRLEIRGGRMVLGFARALDLSARQFRDLSKTEEAV